MRERTRKALALLLVVAMALSLVPAAYAAPEDGSISLPFTAVADAQAPELREPVEEMPPETPYDADETVRVSIVLEEPATLERGYATAGIASNGSATAYRSGLQKGQETMAQTISRQALSGETLDVVWNLTLAANLISANVRYGDMEAIEAVPGVKEVILETRYEPAVYATGEASPNMATSGQMIGTSAAYAAGYNGAGMRIAVIDTGTDTDHKSFDAAAFDYALAEDEKISGKTYDLLDAAEIGSVLVQLNAYKRTLQNGRPTASTPTAEKLYGTTKLPYNYNYVDGDFDVTHDNDTEGEHGSHVAGIATANRYVKTEDGFTSALDAVKVQGVAPDAQLITMKVFGKNGGAYDSDYMAAIEDAILLGCDVVNLSLGSSNPGNTYSETYQSFLEQLKDTDTVVAVAAGNAGTWADGAWNGHLYSDAVSLDMVGSPGSYTNSFTVASADNVGYTGQYLAVGTRQIFYTETASVAPSITTLAGQALDYVLLEGIGDYGAWDGIDLTGKVAVCARGDINFSQKAQNAADAGAAAVLIYNNEAGSINMDLSDYTGSAPCVSITQADGAWMKEQAEAVKQEDGESWYYAGSLTVAEGASSVVYDTPITMSDFSSWGVPGSLELKPEITAPGGNIYSVNGLIPGGESYETMSGTSMASPQIAGMSALVAQYIEEAGLQEQTNLSPRVLTQSLLMSTAEPLMDAESGSYYPVIQQGAGLANVGNAISASSYVLVDGQPDGKVKAELGDDPERTGAYQFSFTLNNLTEESQEYLLSAALFTQDLFEDYASESEQWLEENGEEFETAWYLSKTTTALDADVTWTVDGKTVEADNRLIHMDFDGNGTVNRDDAQALLDYIAGNREEIFALDYADLDGSGDVTTYDAYLLLEGLNGGAVTLPAGGKTDVTVTMTLTEAQKKALDEHYVNGAYVEGYVFAVPTATREGVRGVTHSIPVLAFYGNWTDASMYESGCKASNDLYLGHWPYMGLGAVNYLTYTTADSNGLYYFGENPTSAHDTTYVAERASLNNQNGDALRQYFIAPIRNVAAGKLVITNCDTGEVYFQREFGAQKAAYYLATAQAWVSPLKVLALDWKGTDANGVPLAEGTGFDVTVVLAPEYYVNHETGQVDWDALGDGAYLSTRAYIDNTAPELVGLSLDPLENTVTFRFQDNRFVAGRTIISGQNGGNWGCASPDQQEPGVETTNVFKVRADRFIGNTLQVYVYDYAYNISAYEIDISSLATVQNHTEYEFGMFPYGSWIVFNRPDEEDKYIYPVSSEYKSNVADIRAATNADGFVFSSDGYGNLYVAKEKELNYETRVRNLGCVPADLAYNPMDQMIYGVTEDAKLFRVSQMGTEMELLGSIATLNTNTLACDDAGTFYCLEYPTGQLYSFTLNATSTPTLVGSTGREMDGPQSLEWNCNDGLLYWGWCNNPDASWWIDSYVLQVNPDSGATEEVGYLWEDPLLALFVYDLDRNDRWDDSRYPQTDVVSEIALADSLNLLKYETKTLSADVLPWTVSDRTVTWSTSDPRVATVDETGTVTAVGAGKCVITAASTLDPQITESCTVTVDAYTATLKGVMENPDGTTKLFTWNSHTEQLTEGATLPVNVGAAAYDPEQDLLYVQDRSDANYMHKLQANSGELLETSPDPAKSVASWDMTFCQYLGEDSAVSVFATYLCAPGKLMDNNQLMGVLNLSYYLTWVTHANYLTSVTSAGVEEITVDETDEEGNVIGTETHLAECFYMLDDMGYVWAVWMYPTGEGTYGATLGVYPTDLVGKLPFPREGDSLNCSLVEDPNTGALYLSYFTGNGTEFYGLYPQWDANGEIDSFRAGKLGNLQEGVWPVALYTAESTGAQTSGKRLCQQPETATIQTNDFVQMEAAQLTAQKPTGKLQSLPQEPAQAPQTDETTVSIQIPAPKDSTNGLVHLTYDPALLTLDTVTPYAGLSSVNRETDGQVTLAYAGIPGLSGNSAGEVTFRVREDASGVTKVTCDTLEQGSQIGTPEEPVTTATFTYALSGGQVTGSADHDCPSLRFQDLKAQWYHDGVDYVLERKLMVGVSDTRFAPNGAMTRGQLMTVLYRMAGEPETKGQSPFADVKAGQYYTEPIAWAFETGIAKGVTATAFAPNAPVTREQMVTFLARYAQLQDMDTTSSTELDFTDAGSVSGYAQEPMAWAVETGLVQGMGNGKLNPKGPATRAQMATVLMRFCESILK